MAWSACNDMHKTWTSQLNRNTLSCAGQRRRHGLNNLREGWMEPTPAYHWEFKISHGRAAQPSQSFATTFHVPFLLLVARRVLFSGHFCRDKNEVIRLLLLCNYQHGKTERRNLSLRNVISRDTDIKKGNIGTAIWTGKSGTIMFISLPGLPSNDNDDPYYS